MEWLDHALWIIATLWVLFALAWSWAVRSVERLPGALPEPPQRRVSIVVAARNERRRVETTVKRLLDQRAVDLEVVVVDDRSDDGTTEILAALQADRRDVLTVCRIDEVPDGWIGKCHALETGARAATGEWILFTDADVWMSPEVVARAVAAAEARRADQLCLFPSERVCSISGRAANLAFSAFMVIDAAWVNADRWPAFVGIGAFNLVRAEAYRAIGGHEPLRLEVCDDMKLGLLLGRAGYRTRALLAGEDVEVEWSASASGFLVALEKNLFAMLRYNVVLATLTALAAVVLWAGAVSGPLTLRPAGIAAGLGLLSLSVPARMTAVRAGWDRLSPLLMPLILPLLPLALLRSTWVTLRQGGVCWRDTFYPLKTLRRGVVR